MRSPLMVVGILAAATLAVSRIDIARSSMPAVSVVETPAAPEHPTLEITYIANEGVLIASGDQQVLIDGLHREYKPDYAFLPYAEREQIETAQPPFDDIDLILVSHRHLDHFHPESVGRHLRHNPGAELVSSQQVVGEIEEEFKDFGMIQGRISIETPPMHEKVATNAGGIDFEILRIAHAGRRHQGIENLGHLITLGGKKVLHVGDAEASARNFEPFNLDEEGIDVAFLPTWFLLDEDARDIVMEYINPRYIVAVHLAPKNAERLSREILRLYPNAVAFTDVLGTRSY